MKNLFTKIVLFIALSYAWSNYAIAQWAYVDRGASAGASGGLCVLNGKIYSTSAGNGVYVSSNGKNWSQVSTGMASPTGLQAKFIASLGTNLYVSTPIGIYKSVDEAANWTLLPNDVLKCSQLSYPHFFYEFSNLLFAVMIAPVGTAGTGTGVYKSADGGSTWVEINSGISVGAACYRMAQSGSTLFLGTSVGLYKSTDNGNNWQSVSTLSTGQIHGLVNYKNRLITFGKYSDDSGVTWQNGGDYTAAIPAIASVYNGLIPSGDTLYAFSTSNFASAVNNGLAFTTNKGDTWQIVDKTGLGSFDLQTMYDLVSFKGDLYITTYLGVMTNKSAVGINSVTRNSYLESVYPIPSNGNVNFKFKDNHHLLRLEITDLLGRKFNSIDIEKRNEIGVDFNSPGILLYKLIDINNNVVYINKIIFQ